MKRPLISFVALLVPLAVAVAGCASASPPVAPTQTAAAPAKPTVAPTAAPAKPSDPTRAPAAPTSTQAAAPAKKVDFPEKGKTITFIVPYAAGGNTDVAARLLSALAEKELGTTIQVVNRAGASSQIGLTELYKAKPDGYTIGYAYFPTAITTYLDPERQAPYTRKDFQPVASHFAQVTVMSVHSSSPYRTVKDVIDAAKANPGKIKVGTAGIMGTQHLAVLQLQKLTGVEFAIVHFDGGAPEVTALLGNHIDVGLNGLPEIPPHVKTGQFRVIGIMGNEEVPIFPGVKTLEAQGYKVYSVAQAGISAPAGTPRGVVDILTRALKKAMDADEHKKKMDELGYQLLYQDPDQYAATWAAAEEEIKPLMDLAKKK